MKKIRKGTQLKLTNPKNAGRKAIHDAGIRHTSRALILTESPLHLTIKLKRADIRNKMVLRILKHAILRARLQGLKIIHFSLEHDHIHLYGECENNIVLGRGMKAFGVSLVRAINKLNRSKGSLYKYRYHLRILKSASEVKNVINYILKNGIKHGRALKVINPYNSALVLHDFGLLKIHLKKADIYKMVRVFFKREGIQREMNLLKGILDEIEVYRRELTYI